MLVELELLLFSTYVPFKIKIWQFKIKTNQINTTDHKWADFGVLKGKRDMNEPGVEIMVKYLSIVSIVSKNPLD